MSQRPSGSLQPPPDLSHEKTVRVGVAPTQPKIDQEQVPTVSPSSPSRLPSWLIPSTLALLMVIETILLTISLVPGTITTTLGWSPSNGPFPALAAPVITALFYLAPCAIGLLARRWEVAIIGATVPAWASIGFYIVAASYKNGIFTFARGAQPTYYVGMLELFAALGAIGWLARRMLVTK